MDLHFLSDPQTWLSLITLTALEVVLGIDNIIVISILAGRLPNRQQPRARLVGLAFALVTRILLLCLDLLADQADVRSRSRCGTSLSRGRTS